MVTANRFFTVAHYIHNLGFLIQQCKYMTLFLSFEIVVTQWFKSMILAFIQSFIYILLFIHNFYRKSIFYFICQVKFCPHRGKNQVNIRTCFWKWLICDTLCLTAGFIVVLTCFLFFFTTDNNNNESKIEAFLLLFSRATWLYAWYHILCHKHKVSSLLKLLNIRAKITFCLHVSQTSEYHKR